MSDKTVKNIIDDAVDEAIKTAKNASKKSKEEIPEEKLSENDIKFNNFVKNFKVILISGIIIVVLALILGNWAVNKLREEDSQNFSIEYTDPTIDPNLLGQLSPTLESTEEVVNNNFLEEKPIIDLKSIDFSIDLFKITIFLILLFSFLDVYPRGIIPTLVWFMTIVVGVILVFRWDHESWKTAITASVAFTIACMVVPILQRKLPVFEKIDLSNVFIICSILIVIWFADWPNVSYPYYLDQTIVVIVFVVSFLREASRTIWASSIAILFGVAMGKTLNPWVILILSMITFIGIIFLEKQETGFSLYRDNKLVDDPIGGESILPIKPWDIVLGMIFAFAISAYIQHGNFIIPLF